MTDCFSCHRKLHKNKGLKCEICLTKFHFKCCTSYDKSYFISTSNWYCNNCNVLPFANLTDAELADQFDNLRSHSNKTKCFSCNKKIKKNVRYKNCFQCHNPFHICCSTKGTQNWTCSTCTISELPFSSIGNDEFSLNLLDLNKILLKALPALA